MEFQLSHFKPQKMLLLKCYTQYASKFGKLSSDHRTGKCVFLPIPKKGIDEECAANTTIAVNSVQFSSVAHSCPTLCNSMNRSKPGLPVHHQLPEFTQTQCPLSQ